MIKPYVSFTQQYAINRTDTTSLNNSYLALKQGVMSELKTAAGALNAGFVFVSETAPTASGTQTITILYDTPYGYQFRQNVVFTISTSSPFTITVTLLSDFIRNNVLMQLHATQTIASSLGNPTEVLADADSVCVITPNCFRLGFLRANQTIVALANIFDNASHTLLRYKWLQTNDYAWGGVRDGVTNMPIHTITSALTAIAYPVQVTAGFLKAAASVFQLLSMNEVYFNETSTATSNFICKVESDPEMMLLTMPSPVIPTGTKVKIEADTYYVISQLNGKAVLGLI